MNDNHINIVNSHHVEGWLMDVPGYREDYHHESFISESQTIEIESLDSKDRPLSMASIRSEDSVNLEALISANLTLNVDDETELPFLDALDLEETREDFWKVDTTLDTQLLSEKKSSSIEEFHSIYYSSKKAAENDYLDTLNYSPPSSYKNDDFIHGPNSVTIPSKLQVLPISPKSISSSESIRRGRSGSFSSENSLNSQSTITHHLYQRHQIYPSESTSTSSIGSHSTATSGLMSRSITTCSVKSENSNIRQPPQTRVLKNKLSVGSSLSDYSRSIFDSDSKKQQTKMTASVLARRATHIPAPSSTQTASKLLTASTIIPSRTKSTYGPLRTTTKQGSSQPSTVQKRASHIPTPASTRSISALGHASIFGSGRATAGDYPSRPKTSMGATTTAKTTSSHTLSIRKTTRKNEIETIQKTSKTTHLRAPTTATTRAASSLGRFSTTRGI